MNNIGIKLKEKREGNGLSIEEVAEDLKMRPSQISNIELGNAEEFKDVFTLKCFIRDYAKYLGLDSEKIIDEFNEYLFDATSKIPVDLIEKAKKNKKSDDEKSSPYTNKKNEKNKKVKVIVGFIIFVLVIIIGYIVISNLKGNDFSDNNITYSIRR